MRIHQPGASKFTQLSDVPSSYLGEANQHLAVNALETGIDFVAAGGGGGVNSVVAGTGIAVDNTDPANPVVSATGGAGSFAVTETEVDFGTKPTTDATFTVTDAAITATSKIIVTESGNPATGRADGDSLWDSITYAAKAATGQFTLYAKASGAVAGPRKLYYTYA